MSDNTYDHFKGKNALGHVVEARTKGKIASSESHGLEVPGHTGEFLYNIKDSAALLLLFWLPLKMMGIPVSQIIYLYIFFFCGWVVWTIGRSAFLGWWRLKRLNRLISEEKWEIEHNREQEKQELQALYKAKGFSGKLLQEVIEVLMADDNRLLQIMLEEEMGLTLSSFEHPLKHALFAGIGVFCSFSTILLSIFYFPEYGIYVSSISIIVLSVIISSKKEKAEMLSSTVWILAITALSAAFTYFISQALKVFFL